MHVHIRYFAALREKLGRDGEILEIPDRTDIAGIRTILSQREPSSAPLLARCIAARNRENATDETLLEDEDEVVFLPPFAGGRI
jgi:molybdopterin synthase sulfur carrier subunit